jgi:GGDEF domain-containing protein
MNTIGSKIASHTRRLIIWQLICACVPVCALFLLLSSQATWHEERYKEVFDQTAQTIARTKTDSLQEKIASIGSDSLTLSTQASEIFTYSDRFNYNAIFYKEGGFYRSEQKKSFVFYTPIELNQDSRKKAGRLILLSPLLKAQTDALNSFVSGGFIYLDDPFILVSPPVDKTPSAEGELDSITQPLFELFRKNPRKQWRLVLGERPKIISPVFAGNHLIGVAGFELYAALFEDIIKSVPLSKDSFIFIADTQNKTIISSSDTNGFDPQRYLEGSKQEGFNLIEENIEGLPIMIVFGAKISEIDAQGSKLYRDLIGISAVIAASIALFYCLFVLRSAKTTRLLTQSIIRPLDIVARFSYRLGTRKADRLEAMGITEFDDFANQMRLTHAKLLPPLTIDERSDLPNRRALLEDLDGKRGFGLIAIGVHLRCDNDALFIAATNYVLKRSSELIGRVISGDDVIYAIGSNRLAVLTDKEEIESLKAIARKIVDMINNGEFLLDDQPLKVAAIFGVATGDKNVSGAKLIAAAEADLIKVLPIAIDS